MWQPDKSRQKQIEKLQQEGIDALERGDLPPIAKERIQKHLARGDRFFSSDLSVREFLLTKETGIQPISQVMGACFYTVSLYGNINSYMSGELGDITRAQSEVRRIAMERMKHEARLLGASGVIGVRIKSRRPNLGQRSCEFQAYGTAIKLPDHTPNEEPFTCTLNGQEFWQLYKAGYRPTSVVMGVCSYYVYTDWNTQSTASSGLFGNWINQEIPKYTDCFIDARQRALRALEIEVSMGGASGCIGMQIDFNVEPRAGARDGVYDLILHFEILGTAIEPHNQRLPKKNTLFCIDLRKGKEKAGVYL